MVDLSWNAPVIAQVGAATLPRRPIYPVLPYFVNKKQFLRVAVIHQSTYVT